VLGIPRLRRAIPGPARAHATKERRLRQLCWLGRFVLLVLESKLSEPSRNKKRPGNAEASFFVIP